MGFFRLYYVIAAALGFAVNMVTIGLLVPPAARLFGRVSHYIYETVKKPVIYIYQKSTDFFIKNRKILSNNAEKIKKYLKKNRQVVYNNNDHKIGKVYQEGGETGNAIKAKVRKVG